MNDSIQAIDRQENVIEIIGSSEIIPLLVEAGVPQQEIFITEIGTLLTHQIYLPVIAPLCPEPDYIILEKRLPVDFHSLTAEQKFKHAVQNLCSLKNSHSSIISDYEIEQKRVSYYKSMITDAQKMHPFTISDLIPKMNARITKNFERGMLGIRVKNFPDINEKMLGLRGLICLAAAPNCGKTSLTVQLMLEALVIDENVCAIFTSLEMDVVTILEHLYRLCADMTFRELRFKSDHDFSDNKKKANELLAKIESRLRIFGKEHMEMLTAEELIAQGKKLKAETGCDYLFNVIDYLQIWPVAPEIQKYPDLEKDKWLMRQMQKISAAFPDEPILVISESRKPQKSQDEWASSIGDISGSARFGYGFEAVFMINGVTDRDLLNIADNINIKLESPEKKELYLKFLKRELYFRGSVLCYLSLVKIRAGGIKFRTLLEFNYHKDRFSSATCSNSGDLFKIVHEKIFTSQKTSEIG